MTRPPRFDSPRRAATRGGRLLLAAGLALAPGVLCGQVRFSIVDEAQEWNFAFGSGSSRYLRAAAVPGPTRPVVMAGDFELNVLFPGGTSTILSSTVPSVFAGVLDYDPVNEDWEVGLSPQRVDKLEPVAPAGGAFPSASMRDLAAVDRTEYYLTGIVDDALSFQNRALTSFPLLAAPPIPPARGFVARASDGTFTAAHHVDAAIQPRALSTGPGSSFLVVVGQERDTGSPGLSGPDAEVHRYALPLAAAPGSPLVPDTTITDSALDATSLSEVAVSSSDETWVGGTKSGSGFLGGSSDVWLGRADFPGDRIVDDFRAGSEGGDRLYAMERGDHGEIYVAFTVGGRKVSFGGLTYDLDAAPVTAAAATHAFLGMIRSDGSPGWLAPLGFSQTPGGNLFPQGLSVDGGGNAYVTVQGSGDWTMEGVLVPALGTGQVTVSGRGRVVDFSPTPSLSQALCGAVPDVESRLVLGEEGGHSGFATLEAVAVKQSSQFVCWLDPDQPGNTIDALSALVTSTGGQVHNELDYAAYGTVGVSAWLTPDQIRALDNTGVLKVVADPLIIEPDAGFGEVAGPGWGLARLFDPYFVDADDPSASYFYPAALATGDPDPDAPKTVRVYVIDKGLEALEPFAFQDLTGEGGLPIVFDGANGVDVEALVAPTEDGVFVPDTISNHPRQVVNLLAAASLGAAQGTAMEIIPGDMYSGASPGMGNSVTYASYVSHCIYKALTDAFVRDLVEPLPTLIVIASSGMDPQDQVGIGGALDQALLEGVTVILSAGNHPQPAQAGDFVPALHGDKDGVITVGATAFDPSPPADPTLAELNPLYAFGNIDDSGQIISLYAPGSGVDTGFGSASGTSFSCALVAGLAANYLTAHPTATPAEVEAALVQMAVYDPVRDLRLARSACAYEAWLYRNGLGEVASEPEPDYDTDSDLDGDPDLWEFVGSSDPNDPSSRARVPVSFTMTGTTGLISARLPFGIASASDELSDGCWTVPVTLELGDDLENWQVVPPDEIDLGPAKDGLQELRFGIDLEPYSDDRCFLRFAFGPPVSP